MKRIKTTFMALAAFAVITSVSSCTKTCDAGYEGTDCKTEVRAKFTGTTSTSYNASEDGTLSAPATFTITISKSATDVEKILIGNVWDSFTNNVVATVEDNKFTISLQEPDNDDFTVQGSGTISGNVITVTYTVTDNSATPATTDVVTGTWTKI